MISLPESRADANLERGLPGDDGAGSDQLQVVSGALVSPSGPSPDSAAVSLGLYAISTRERHLGAVQALFAERFSYEVLAAGRVAKLRQHVRGADSGKHDRGEIQEWSIKSRLRLYQAVCAIEWPKRLAFVTLTYPGRRELDLLPDTGVKAKLDHRAFKERLVREFDPVEALWKMEYQNRGTPHFHDWLGIPEGVSFDAFEAFVIDAWCGVVGSTGADHRAHGTTVERWVGGPEKYVKAYVHKSAAKEYQHRVPDGWEHPGRFWGLWGLKPDWQAVPVTTERFVVARRGLRGYQKSQGRNWSQSGMRGGFVITQGGAADLVARLVNGS